MIVVPGGERRKQLPYEPPAACRHLGGGVDPDPRAHASLLVAPRRRARSLVPAELLGLVCPRGDRSAHFGSEHVLERHVIASCPFEVERRLAVSGRRRVGAGDRQPAVHARAGSPNPGERQEGEQVDNAWLASPRRRPRRQKRHATACRRVGSNGVGYPVTSKPPTAARGPKNCSRFRGRCRDEHHQPVAEVDRRHESSSQARVSRRRGPGPR